MRVEGSQVQALAPAQETTTKEIEEQDKAQEGANDY